MPLTPREGEVGHMELTRKLAMPVCSAAKRCRFEHGRVDVVEADCRDNGFDALPADVLPIVLTAVARSAASPTDVASLTMTCKAMRAAMAEPAVLASLSAAALQCPAERFSDSYRSFLARCALAGNVEAMFLLGMVDFYCLGNRKDGVKALVRAAKAGHADALFSLAVIHFNGSGSAVPEKKLSVGVLLCASAAQQGHVEALRELGHCFQDGYGIKRNVQEGRRLLMEANLREFVALHSNSASAGECSPAALEHMRRLEGLLQSSKSMASQMLPEALHSGSPQMEGKVAGEGEHRGDSQGNITQPPADAETMAFLQSMCNSLQPLMQESGGQVSALKPRSIQAFLCQWNSLYGSALAGQGLKACANKSCGRTETRQREFRCCALCSQPSYCSRVCQATDWRNGHMDECQADQ